MKLTFYTEGKQHTVTLSETVTYDYVRQALRGVLGHDPDEIILNALHHQYEWHMRRIRNCPCCKIGQPPRITADALSELETYCNPLLELNNRRWIGEEVGDNTCLKRRAEDAETKLFSLPYSKAVTYVFEVMYRKQHNLYFDFIRLIGGERIELEQLSQCLGAFRSKYKTHYAHMREFCVVCKRLSAVVNTIMESRQNLQDS